MSNVFTPDMIGEVVQVTARTINKLVDGEPRFTIHSSTGVLADYGARTDPSANTTVWFRFANDHSADIAAFKPEDILVVERWRPLFTNALQS